MAGRNGEIIATCPEIDSYSSIQLATTVDAVFDSDGISNTRTEVTRGWPKLVATVSAVSGHIPRRPRGVVKVGNIGLCHPSTCC